MAESNAQLPFVASSPVVLQFAFLVPGSTGIANDRHQQTFYLTAKMAEMQKLTNDSKQQFRSTGTVGIAGCHVSVAGSDKKHEKKADEKKADEKGADESKTQDQPPAKCANLMPVVFWPNGTIQVTAARKDTGKELWTRQVPYALDSTCYPTRGLSTAKWTVDDNRKCIQCSLTTDQIVGESWAFTARAYPPLTIKSEDKSVMIRFTVHEVLADDKTPLCYFLDRSYSPTDMEVFLRTDEVERSP